ncbi:MAG TPA: AAA family ATPase [Microthrixaceae bacterium]|nr:AAA family ATPase [Microthrixaceae bacterium]HMT24435.1 AAA family ATPase [Microthrixaceae bacterium]HMT60866.1 AAA family ATPase [Microthrixaceae bacterium]
MIQLRRAQFTNFRLLRDVAIEFATSFDQPLTVIRAENDTGKTTLLKALGWALFGDDALPGSRSTFRLHPIDWDPSTGGSTVSIKVLVEFAALDEESGTEVVFELERSADERLVGDGGFEVSPSSLVLLRHTTGGVQPVENATATIASLLPPGLKDIFFIDGDRALAFIEATDEQGVKRDRVAKAVRALLGLDLLQEAERHVDKARQEAVSVIRKLGAGTDIERLAQREQDLEARLADHKIQLEQGRSDQDASEIRHRNADKRLKDALASGAGEQREIGARLEGTERKLKDEREAHEKHLAAHRLLINSPTLTVALAPALISKAAVLLQDLEQRKVIPSTLPNVIEDRLERLECICGASLAEGTDARRHLEELLDRARDIDDAKDLLRHLNDAVKRNVREAGQDDSWAARLRSSQATIQRSINVQTQLEEEVADLRAQIRGMESTNLEELERLVSQEEREVKRLIGEISRTEQHIRQLEKELKEVDRERSTVERANARVRTGVLKETAAKDILAVIRGTIEVLQGETIDEVSERMNSSFLAMIVADENAGSVVKRVKLTRSHDIVVEGPGGKAVDPDRDLSGAQRRALTLSFILALVKVSGVNAPNIIDTPLGMMDVAVRHAVLRYAALHSSQLIMFLTGSEVLGVEDLLDEFAGRVYTLTNAAHYPTKLLNDPGTDRTETLVCDCNHRQSCDLCRRRTAFSLPAREETSA